ncbi:MAG: serine/threonine-protein kinase [Anaerohalosphaeraceae bacterium]
MFFLKADDNKPYILKHFHGNNCPDSTYIEAIASLLPSYKPFQCGTQRQVLGKSSLKQAAGCFYSPELAAYLEKTILMPKTAGQDWNSLNEQLRNRKVTVSRNGRLALCNNLAQIIKTMEKHQVSHRDLSAGNVFLDKATLEVALIDFDSLYHPRLAMPNTTKIGSEGYIAPFIRPECSKQSFCTIADRFALAILCVEFLILDQDSPFSHDGGIFQQKDLYHRTGKTIVYAEKKLQREFPEALPIFQKAIRSHSFSGCPRPEDWIAISLANGHFPAVTSLPEVKLELPKSIRTTPALVLPENPWKNMKGEENYGNPKPSVNQHHSSALCGHRHFDLDDVIKTQQLSLEKPHYQAPDILLRPDSFRMPGTFSKNLPFLPGQDLSGKDFAYFNVPVPVDLSNFPYRHPVIQTKKP